MTKINIIPGVTSDNPWATPIPAGTVRKLIDYDPLTGTLTWLRRDEIFFASAKSAKTWNTRFAGTPALNVPHSAGYLSGTLMGIKHLAHRVAWAIHTGDWPEEHIDHENGVKHDNRWDNLREATVQVNGQNQPIPSTNTSGVIGVCRHSPDRDDRWMAYIKVSGKNIYLGLYPTLAEAADVRKKAEVRFGFHPNHGRAAA